MRLNVYKEADSYKKPNHVGICRFIKDQLDTSPPPPRTPTSPTEAGSPGSSEGPTPPRPPKLTLPETIFVVLDKNKKTTRIQAICRGFNIRKTDPITTLKLQKILHKLSREFCHSKSTAFKVLSDLYDKKIYLLHPSTPQSQSDTEENKIHFILITLVSLINLDKKSRDDKIDTKFESYSPKDKDLIHLEKKQRNLEGLIREKKFFDLISDKYPYEFSSYLKAKKQLKTTVKQIKSIKSDQRILQGLTLLKDVLASMKKDEKFYINTYLRSIRSELNTQRM